MNVGTPAIKALACLEANEATTADVFIFSHATLQATKDVLNDPTQEFPQEVQEQVLGILNKHHFLLFEDGNISSKAYLAATYLNSSML